jgi:hypothetical protein
MTRTAMLARMAMVMRMSMMIGQRSSAFDDGDDDWTAVFRF